MSNVVSPRLPNAPQEYDARYLDQLNNILRFYFTVVDSAVNQPSSPVLVANLASAVLSGVGSRAFVIDSSVSTFGSTVAGGGSTKVPVYSDGTNWKVG
jgi:hypothetical protein